MLTAKFVRAHSIPSGNYGFAWFFKLVYEFWGFCINGGNDLLTPGGFPDQTLTGTSMPSGFRNGVTSSCLLASGTDGFTNAGQPFFNTINTNAFSASYVNKWLVIWKSGSTNTDDSIYQITKWINSSSIRLNVFQGGTPYTGSLHPSLTERTQINYRILDFAAVAALPGYSTNDWLVLTFLGAADVNPGQALSQVKLHKRTSPNSNVGITMSPSGSWHGVTYDSGSYASGSWSSGSYSSGSYSSGSWSSGSYSSGSYSSGSYSSGSYSSGSYTSGSYSSGSVVYAPGNFTFFLTSSLDFTGSYVDIIHAVQGSTTGSNLTGTISGSFTPTAFNALSGTFYLPDGITPVISGTGLFSGTLDGIDSTWVLTGTFVPDVADFANTSLLLSGTYAWSGSGVFTPTGSFVPSGTFMPGGTFSPTGTFTPAGSFIPSGVFTPTGSFTPEGVFTPSGVFTPTGSFTPQGNLIQPGFYDPTTELFSDPNGGGWFNGSDNPAYITLIGAQDFLIAHYKSGQTFSSGFHIEIPQRLYPQGVDPNPITAMNFGVYIPDLTNGGEGYGGGFFMHNPPDGSTMRYTGLSRRLVGNSDTVSPSTATNGRSNGAYFNTYQNKFLFFDVVLAQAGIPGQYQQARARLRRVRVLPPIIPQFERVGNQGEWLHVVNGVMWPWDNTLLPYNLFLGGN